MTGATRGIGRAITLEFLEQGATVVGVYGSSRQAAETMLEECRQFDGRLQLEQCDVADYAQVEDFFKKIEEKYESIDVLVSNAGIRRDAFLAMMPSEDWNRVIDVNLTGSYNMAKFAVMLMIKKKYGRIIFITSPMAYLGFAGQANYAASKAGQVGMMRSLAKETAKRKITVNCVSPGFIDTEMLDGLSEEQMKEYKKMVPMRRLGKPEEVADAVLYLAGPKSTYVTGSVLEVNGGI